MIDDHLRAARALAGAQKGHPRQVYLRRAISGAYYALFHLLAQSCADELIGATKTGTEAWRRAYRALDHGPAKDALKRLSAQGGDPGLTNFARTFIALQESRHAADYDPRPTYTRAEALANIVQARRAIEMYRDLPSATKVDVVTSVLFKLRR